MKFTGLESLRDGMRVVDAASAEIGTIEHIEVADAAVDAGAEGLAATSAADDAVPLSGPGVAPGGVDATATATGSPGTPAPGMTPVAGADPGTSIDPAAQLRTGYVKVDTKGLFSRDLYVQPDQINDVTDETVTLNVTRDELDTGI